MSFNAFLLVLYHAWLTIWQLKPIIELYFANLWSDLDMWEKFKANFPVYIKVHIFWEGQNFLLNLHHRFVLCSASQIYGKISQNFAALSKYMNFTDEDLMTAKTDHHNTGSIKSESYYLSPCMCIFRAASRFLADFSMKLRRLYGDLAPHSWAKFAKKSAWNKSIKSGN